VTQQCEPFGYALDGHGKCAYLDAYAAAGTTDSGDKLPVKDKICLCYHFSKNNCYTCGHYVYRLSDTSHKLADGSFQLPSAEHIFKDYQFSKNQQIALPAQRIQVVNEFVADGATAQ
jgi:nitronate monooxygenase